MRRDAETPLTEGAIAETLDVSVVSDDVTLLALTSLTVAPGEIVALRGPNGSGKTTLLRSLTGEVRPTSGSVRITGSAPDDRSGHFRRTVAALTGHVPLARDMTIAESCTFVATTWNGDQAEAEAMAGRVLGDLGIPHLAHRFPHELSSGQRQLAELATVLSRPCDLLVLDEPEQRLDDDRIAALAGILVRLRERGAAVVMATHSGALSAQAADRVVTLRAAA